MAADVLHKAIEVLSLNLPLLPSIADIHSLDISPMKVKFIITSVLFRSKV